MKVVYSTKFEDKSADFLNKLQKKFSKIMFEMEADAKRLCLFGRTKVLTNDGFKYIKDLKIGDLVTCNDGIFRPIQQILKSRPENIIRIETIRGKSSKGTVTMSNKHILKSGRGWITAEKLKVGDIVYILAHKCKECNNLCYIWQNFCCTKCSSIYSFKCGKGKVGLKIGWINAKELANKPERLKKIKDWRKKNKEKLQEIYKNNGKKQSKFLKEYYKLHPDKHPNHILAKLKGGTKLEKKVKKWLDILNIEYIFQFHIGRFWVDFYLPKFNIFLEVDGDYWHKDKEKEIKRDKLLKKLFPGIIINHLLGSEIEKLTLEGFKTYINNGLGDILVKPIKITKIKKRKPRKYEPLFYDLVINNGNGKFFANNILVHNCPVDSGLLRNSINLVRKSDSEYHLISPVSYSAAVEFGTKPHIIKAKNAKALHFTVDNKSVFAKQVQHPGTNAHPFMRPSFDMAKNKVKNILQ